MSKIVFPEYISLTRWADTLVGEYPEEQLPILLDENKWAEWASEVAGTGIFSRSNVPKPIVLNLGNKKTDFSNWQDWAKVVYNIMFNEEQK
jgi:hypothetical protein